MDQQWPAAEANLPTTGANPTAASRSSRGKQKIKIEKIENQKSLDVTFSKRRKGLFKKAMELGVVCGTPVAAVVFSRSGRAFSVGNPSVDAVLDQYLAGSQCDVKASSDDAQLLSLQQQCEELKQLRSLLEAPIDGMELPELLQMLETLESIRAEMLQKTDTSQNTA